MSDKSLKSKSKPKKPPDGASKFLQYICCGKEKCKTCHGRQYKHGPYVYAHVNRPNGVGKWTWYVRKATPGDLDKLSKE